MMPRSVPTILAALVILGAVSLAAGGAASEGETVHRSDLGPGLFHMFEQEREDLPFTLELDYTSTSAIDIYVLEPRELDKYLDGRDFEPLYKVERTVSGNPRYSMDSDVEYTVVVDNMDNARATDAVPSGNVTYDIDLEVLPFEIGVGMGIICGSIIIGGAVLIIGIIWLVMKRRQMRAPVRPPPHYLPPLPDPSGDPNYPPLDDDDLEDKHPPPAPAGSKRRKGRRDI